MAWLVRLHPAFEAELVAFNENVHDELLGRIRILRDVGPILGRPLVDTLAGSRFANMKELRFEADGGVWRVAFAFDPTRAAILLVAGDKKGVAQSRFYDALISRADARFAEHLASLKENGQWH
jgi:hypothetical protein